MADFLLVLEHGPKRLFWKSCGDTYTCQISCISVIRTAGAALFLFFWNFVGGLMKQNCHNKIRKSHHIIEFKTPHVYAKFHTVSSVCSLLNLLRLSWRMIRRHGNSIWQNTKSFSTKHHEGLKSYLITSELNVLNLLGTLHQSIKHYYSCYQ